MGKKTILSFLFIILLAVVFYFILKDKNVVPEPVVPSGNTNPMDKKPEINPVEASNPFRSVKTNPFE